MISNKLSNMKVEIIDKELKLEVSGFSGTATNNNYGATAFALMDKMWPIIRSQGLKHKGMNVWIYEEDHQVFAGVELLDPSVKDTGLELKTIVLKKYAYYKHIGPYNMIGQAGDNMRTEIQRLGYRSHLPYIEIYGHWNNDETKLETELLVALD